MFNAAGTTICEIHIPTLFDLYKSLTCVINYRTNTRHFTSRHIKETDDEVLHMEMSSLLESVAVSGQHVLLAAQKLSIQPSLAEHREELITATQNVFLRLVKVKYDFSSSG